MARVSNRFTDPATGAFYDWRINHDTEDEGGRERQITLSGNTSGLGLVRQQGEQTPLTLKYSGSILHLSQLQAFWHWFQLCQSQTIFFRDFYGDEYEVTITTFSPVRHRGENRNDASIPHHYWTYTIEMQVLRVVSGTLAEVTP
jgi:hypothetical protein